MDLVAQLDDFWREALQSDTSNEKLLLNKYNNFVKMIQNQVSHLPQEEQNRLAMQVVVRNAEYIALAKGDREALKVRLGLPASSASANRLAQVAVETAVRATIWQSIAALFRGFR